MGRCLTKFRLQRCLPSDLQSTDTITSRQTDDVVSARAAAVLAYVAKTENAANTEEIAANNTGIKTVSKDAENSGNIEKIEMVDSDDIIELEEISECLEKALYCVGFTYIAGVHI